MDRRESPIMVTAHLTPEEAQFLLDQINPHRFVPWTNEAEHNEYLKLQALQDYLEDLIRDQDYAASFTNL